MTEDPKPGQWAFDLADTDMPTEVHSYLRGHADIQTAWRESPHGPALLWLARARAKNAGEVLRAGAEGMKLLSDQYFDGLAANHYVYNAEAFARSAVLVEAHCAFGASPPSNAAVASYTIALHQLGFDEARFHDARDACRLLLAEKIRDRVPEWPG